MPERSPVTHAPPPRSRTASARSTAADRGYVVATEALARRLSLAPHGRPIADEDRFDPTRRSSAPMLDRIERLDAAIFGPRRMATPRWALYDCAGLPGVIAGVGLPAGDVAPSIRAALGLDDAAEGLAPISLAIATPMLGDGSWLLYALGWLDEVPAELGVATAALVIELVRARRITCAAQWGSPELSALCRFAPLEVLAAWLPAHDHPATCVARFDVPAGLLPASPPPRERPETSSKGASPACPSVDALDDAALERLQAELEAGRRAWIAGPPAADGAALRVPLLAAPERP